MAPIVTYAMTRKKIRKVRDDITKDTNTTAGSALLQLSFSNGWLQKFLIRHGLKSRCLHGEAVSADAEAVDRGSLALQSVTAGLCHQNSISGRKNTNKCLTVAVSSNAGGSLKLPSLFVGTARQPWCFKGKIGEELGIDYVNAPKGWMNTQLFCAWLTKFNETMRSGCCHVLLLLGNTSYHRSDEQLSNVQVLMLPLNTAAHLQPQDAGITRSFGAQVNRLKNRHNVDAFGATVERSDVLGKGSVDRDFEP